MSLNAMSVKVLTENMHNGKVNNDALSLYLRIKFDLGSRREWNLCLVI